MHKLIGKLAVCAVSLALAGGAAAQDDEPLDRKVHTTLREVINQGADMYNNGDPSGCYRLFEGALLTVKPLLDHRPDAQRTIERGLADAARNPDMRRRAWALRTVLDDVRTQVGGKGAVAKGGPKGGAPAEKKTLWDRLGGEANVRKVVDDFAAIAGADKKVNFTRDGKYNPTPEQMVELKKSLVALISANTGGPIKYTGKSMKEVHKGMGITNAEFDALANDLVEALAANKAGPEEIAGLLKIVESTRPDIVEAKAEEKPKDDDDPKPKPKPKGKAKDDMPDDEKPKDKPKEKDKEKDDEKPKEKDKDDKKDEDKKKDDKKDDQ